MSQLDNAFTTNTEGLHRHGDPDNSMDFIPVNEDWRMLVELTTTNINGVVSGRKINDPTAPQVFSASVRYVGKNETVPDNFLEIGTTVIFLRYGTGFDENAWVCLVNKVDEIILVDPRYVFSHYALFGTVGSAGNYFCAVRLEAKKSYPVPIHTGHVPTAMGWKFNYYTAYNPTTQEYSGFSHSNNKTQFAFSTTFFSDIYIKTAGTGIADKDSFYPDFDLYLTPPQIYYGEFEETGPNPQVSGIATGGSATHLTDTTKHFYFDAAVDIGDQLNTLIPTRSEPVTNLTGTNTLNFASGDPIVGGTTTYSMPQKKRKSITEDFQIYQYPRWSLVIHIGYSYYDPTTDDTTSNPAFLYMAIDGGTSLVGRSGAHKGFNDSATNFLIFGTAPPALGAPVPGWPGITDAIFYCEEAYFKNTRNIQGGRLYAPRDRMKWWRWNGTTWVRPSATGYPTLLWAADEWKTQRRSLSYATNMPILYLY